MGVVDPIEEAPRLEEVLMHGSLVTEQVEAYPLEDSLVDHLEHRQVDLAVSRQSIKGDLAGGRCYPRCGHRYHFFI